MKNLMLKMTESRTLRTIPFWPSSPSDLLEEELDLIKTYLPYVELCVHKDLLPYPPKGLPFLAHEEDFQFKSFLRLISKNGISVLWAVRGGYGAIRWTPKLLKEKLPQNIPMVVGFSDLTFLHLALTRLGYQSIHGPLITTLKNTDTNSIKALGLALHSNKFPKLYGESLKGGKSQGKLVVGNLTCLGTSIGTPLEPQWDNAIIAFEDHNEDPYRIDRILSQFLHAGIFERVNGVAIGTITPRKRNDNKDVETMKFVLRDRLSSLSCPVVFDLPFGHGSMNMPLLVNGDYFLDGDSGILMKL
ncbi:Muramoyltetrapeptide carboxypeptidase [Dissulfuribacter thermophilus]|uniref:Muramoyltetrapeptide carboxypeptidase n=1 Tax=Dissulfuribacter thermophilus TaxID=1156395 RepID=A0A1B9F346_9BACT|nr:LD-carboxypeptidase [Dissulfuribacter thermophilus]OCC14357.1 Muramoyltetrapeptide carboxypeptidase [Dissulfuribacter thermophilus]